VSFFDNIALGFEVALTLNNLGFALLGCLVGTLIGVLPGLGPLATIAILMPITFYLTPEAAIIMLAGIYYGSQYGGSTTAILMNMPGESSAVVTCLDGYQMAKKGRGGAALTVAALGSFFAGCVATIFIALAAPPLARLGILFGPADYFALMVFGLTAAVVLAQGSLLKAIAMVFAGLLLGLVGTDVNSGAMRFTFGAPQLFDGLNFVALAMGLFGVSEIIDSLIKGNRNPPTTATIDSLYPTREEFRAAAPASVRGTVLGSVLGVLPGGGALLSSFASYALEKRLARNPAEFGRGAIQGVAGPESANNAGAQTTFIPMLTLGIPPNAILALLMGALMIHGIQPGPGVVTQHPQLFWGLVASMWVANAMLVIINLPLVGIWVQLLRVPYRLLFPVMLFFCAVGAFIESGNVLNVYLMAAFGVLGYVMKQMEFEPAPLILAFILGPMMEEYFRRAMLLSRGDPTTFVSNPISLVLLLMTVGLAVLIVLPNFRKVREEAFQE